jgi:ubiquinone/menaquinone biosynthesis C-methylase UbiE
MTIARQHVYSTTRPCPVCDATTASALQQMHFTLPDGHPLPDRYTVAGCATCGFVYADTSATQPVYDRYYAELSKYADATTGTGGGESEWDRRRLEDTARVIAVALGDRSARTVDIGCANGGLLAALAKEGLTNLQGVDPSRACVDATNRISHAAAFVGGLFDLPPAVAGADCAILSHVLEHVRDVPRALAQLHGAVRAGGLVYVEVPDATRYSDCLVAPFQDFNVEHINHFSPVSLANAMERNGFVVMHVERKTIAASATAPYPALFVIARATLGGVAGDVRYDDGLVPAIAEYIDRSRQLLDSIARHLERALDGVPEIVVWGTGQTTLTAVANTSLGGARVVAFTDSSTRYHGRRLAGIPVVAPEDIRGYDVPIVVGSIIHHDAIASRIRELGLPNDVIPIAPG